MTKKKTDGQNTNSSSPCSESAAEQNGLNKNIDEVAADVAGADEVTQSKSESELLQEQLADEKNNYLRLLADFDNFRKRMTEQALRMRQDGIAHAIEVIFPVLDSIDRAMTCVDDASKEGLQLIKKQLDSSLTNLGVEEIGEQGTLFDPNIHHAVMRVEDESNTGKVVEVFQKGYRIKDRIIRCAMVKVAE